VLAIAARAATGQKANGVGIPHDNNRLDVTGGNYTLPKVTIHTSTVDLPLQ
jgi:hypothetical protein